MVLQESHDAEVRNLGKNEFEKDVDDALDKVKAGARAVKNKVEEAVKDAEDKLENAGKELEEEYKKEKLKGKLRDG